MTPTTRSPLLVSVTSEELYLASTGRDERLAAFCDVVAARADGIELFVEPSKAYMTAMRSAVSSAADRDLPVRTVHAPPLGVHEPSLDGEWDVELNTHLREILIQYDSDAASADEESSGTGVRRKPKVEPAVATAHPPRFPVADEIPTSTARRRVVETLRSTVDHVASDVFVDGSWTPPTVAVENVCPRPGFDYLLTTPEDAERLHAVAAETGDDRLAFTCDIGHARNPTAMLTAMGAPASVHLHGRRGASRSVLAAELPDGVEPSALATEPADGTVQHLPPSTDPDRTLTTLDWLDDAGHDCPLVVELQRPCKTPAVARNLFDWFDAHR